MLNRLSNTTPTKAINTALLTITLKLTIKTKARLSRTAITKLNRNI